MKNIIAIAIIILIFATTSFAATKQAVAPEGAPQIMIFRASLGNGNSFEGMQSAEQRALVSAQTWLNQNYSHIRVISHSVAGNWVSRATDGFSTVTILYVEK